MAPPLPPGLMDDLIGEILLRLPPADPACLVRVSLVCKSWRNLVFDRGFLREYRAFHRTPPVLGFFHTQACGDYYNESFVPGFVATTTMPVPPPLPEAAASAGPGHGNAPKGTMYSSRTLDCRHGRVLFHTVIVLEPSSSSTLTVWDPVTGDHKSFSPPADIPPYDHITGAVLCASAAAPDGGGCDHRECSAGGPFLVVIAGLSHGEDFDQEGMAWARVYSSETATWSAPTTLDAEFSVDPALPGLLAAGAVYFMLDEGTSGILRYHLACGSGGALSVMKAPPWHHQQEPINMIFATARDGELGAATVEGNSLHLWSWDAGVEEWARARVIELLDTINPFSIGTKFDLVGSAQGAGMIFITATNDDDHHSIFTVELKSGHITKTGKTGNYGYIFPLMSFCTPAY